MEKLIGYKVMTMENNNLVSLAKKDVRFKAEIGKEMFMDGKGVWLSTNKDFVLDYYSNENEKNEVLLTLEFDKDFITSGELTLNDREPVLTVPIVKILEIHKIVDGELIKYDEKEKLSANRKIKNKI